MEQTVDRVAAQHEGQHSRLAGITIAAGVAFVIGALGTFAVDAAWLGVLVGMALLIYAAPKLHRVQAPEDGWAGVWGSRLILFGAAVVVALGVIHLVWELLGDPGEPTWAEIAWMVGFFAFAAGIVLFGIGSIMSGRLTKAAPALMLLGLVAAIAIDMATGAFFEGDEAGITPWGFHFGVLAFGLGLAWMGWALRTGPDAR